MLAYRAAQWNAPSFGTVSAGTFCLEVYMNKLTFLRKIPAVIPAGNVLVHSWAKPTERLGSRGLRAWLSTDTSGLEVCPCGWASDLGKHYRIAASADK